jgi:hypothetical protein
MDVFENPSLGPFDPGQVQIHDFNPGDLNEPGLPDWVFAGGVFWTSPVPKRAVRIHPGRGDAHFEVENHPIFDFFTAANAVDRPPEGPPRIPTELSVDIAWRGTGERQQVREATFGGAYENATGEITWSASHTKGEPSFFDTTGSSAQNVTHAFTAHIRNGVFFP